MQISFRKAALIAGVALAATRVFGWVSLFWSIASHGTSAIVSADSLLILVESAAGALVELPVPVLLVTLYVTDVRLRVPQRLRVLSVVAAAVQALASVGPRLFSFTKFVNQAITYSDVHIFGGQPLATQLWRWLHSEPALDVMREGFFLVARMVFFLFLVMLSRQVADPGLQANGRKSIARTAAMVAIGTTSFMLLVEIVGEPNFYRQAILVGQTSGYILFWFTIWALSYLSFAIVPWIVFKSIPQHVASETSSDRQRGEATRERQIL